MRYYFPAHLFESVYFLCFYNINNEKVMSRTYNLPHIFPLVQHSGIFIHELFVTVEVNTINIMALISMLSINLFD
jgi:hypothetical protein